MARRKTPRGKTLADKLALFNAAAEWSLRDFCKYKIDRSDDWAYRHMTGPAGQRPGKTDREATLTIANGVAVPLYKDTNGRWRIAHHEYDAAVARHTESVAS